VLDRLDSYMQSEMGADSLRMLSNVLLVARPVSSREMKVRDHLVTGLALGGAKKI